MTSRRHSRNMRKDCAHTWGMPRAYRLAAMHHTCTHVESTDQLGYLAISDDRRVCFVDEIARSEGR